MLDEKDTLRQNESKVPKFAGKKCKLAAGLINTISELSLVLKRIIAYGAIVFVVKTNNLKQDWSFTEGVFQSGKPMLTIPPFRSEVGNLGLLNIVDSFLRMLSLVSRFWR